MWGWIPDPDTTGTPPPGVRRPRMFGEKICAMRLARSLTVSYCAERAGVTPRRWRAYEKGNGGRPGPASRRGIEQAFRLDDNTLGAHL